MSLFRSKQVVVHAIQFKGFLETEKYHFRELRQFTEDNLKVVSNPGLYNEDLFVYDKLHDTWVKVLKGQWIIRGTKGEYYPCDDEVLQEKYEAVTSEDVSKMSFGDALRSAIGGKKIARKNWNAKEQYVYYVPAAEYPAMTEIAKKEFGENEKVPYTSYLAIKTVQNTVAPWLASQTDLLSDDWFIVE